MIETIIRVESLSKLYRIGRYSYSTFRENVYNSFSKIFKRNKLDHDTDREIWALKDVSFEVKRGEAVGIIGLNGAGKTTILRLLAGVTSPTKGRIFINGKIAAMIELSAGFHGELTGRENIYLNGVIVGMTKKEIKEKFDSIVEFSELSPFIDTPFKRYSSGMKARLGFAVAIHTEPDILLIDEVLSVGDIAFQNKCLEKMEEYKNKDTTIIFVSHNLESIRKLCPSTVLLHYGEIRFNGKTEQAINEYFKIMSEDNISFNTNDKLKKAEIIDIKLMNKDGIPTYDFKAGDKAKIKIMAKFNEKCCSPAFGLFIRRNDGLMVMDTTSKFLNVDIRDATTESVIEVNFEFEINLLKGNYQIGSHIVDPVKVDFYDYKSNAISFSVTDHYSFDGVADLKPKCYINRLD